MRHTNSTPRVSPLSRSLNPFLLYADIYSRNATPPAPHCLPRLSLAYQNAYCTLDKILARHFSFNMQLGNSASSKLS